MATSQPGKRHTALMAGFIGNVVEWYDFALYGYMASFISQLFFPSEDQLASMLATYGVFAAGFLMRPLGSAFFGWLGDTVGRAKTMLVSVAMMAFPTVAIGVLPTYAQVGIVAPILLVLIRLVQGLSVGGEFSSSVTYLAETAKPERRGWSASWANHGSISGMLLGSAIATGLTSWLTHETIMDWAWRLPFLFGAVLGITAFILRRHLSRSSHFKKHHEDRDETSPLKEAFTVSLKQTIVATLFAAAYGAIFYITLVYLPNWAKDQGGFDLEFAMQLNTGATALLLLVIPLSGWLSDHLMRRTHIVALAMLGFAVAAWPLSGWMLEGSVTALVVMQFTLALILGLPLGAAPAMFAEMFPARDRLSGYSVSYNLGLGVVGGATPMLATWLIDITGMHIAPTFVLVSAGALGLAMMIISRDRSREALR